MAVEDPRLSLPRKDVGKWGALTNKFLRVSHNEDGTLKASVFADLQSMFGIFGTGLLFDDPILKVSAVLQKYHAIDPSANVQTLLGVNNFAAFNTLLGFGTGDSPILTDLTLSTPSNIYSLSHDSFAGFVANEHIDWTNASSAFATTSTGKFGTGGVGLYDDTAAHYLYLKCAGDSENEADRILAFDLMQANKTITLTGNPTLDNWFDQSVKVAASPTFANPTVTSLTIDGNSLDTNEWGVLNGVTANMVLDWTADQGATNIHNNNLANSGNWDTAYGWGNHDGLYHPVAADLDTICDVGATTDQTITAAGFTTAGTIQAEHLYSTDDIEVADRIFHSGDTDTYIEFNTNILNFIVGDKTGMSVAYGAIAPLQYFNFLPDGDADARMFSSITAGITKELKIYGYRTADALRALEIGVGVDANDTASFDGVSNYLFDGKICFTRTDLNEAITGALNDGYLDYLATTAHRFNADINIASGKVYKVNGVALNTIPRKLYVSAQLFPGTGTYDIDSYVLDPGEYTRVFFRVPDYVDDSGNIGITFTLLCDTADATIEMLLSLETVKTDNSEASSWNVEDATAVTFDSTNANRVTVYQYTLSSASFEKGDLISILLKNDEAAAVVEVLDCVFEMDCLAA